jgi:hypothetical protein
MSVLPGLQQLEYPSFINRGIEVMPMHQSGHAEYTTSGKRGIEVVGVVGDPYQLQNPSGKFMLVACDHLPFGKDGTSAKMDSTGESEVTTRFRPLAATSNRHRASCHRCGNLRKKNVLCSRCPHTFCYRCADKMREEHGHSVFDCGCPVCKVCCFRVF